MRVGILMRVCAYVFTCFFSKYVFAGIKTLKNKPGSMVFKTQYAELHTAFFDVA
jgi:hypothetical protein